MFRRLTDPIAQLQAAGYRVQPAWVNAHDHLELNHYPRTKYRDRYPNAHEWGADMNAGLDEPPFRELRAAPLRDQVFIGGLKNLLSGALTVAHHNPPHRALFARDYPVRVIRRYGWAHSLHFSTEAAIVRSYRATPPNAPWTIHLAEGTDAIAAGEYTRLKALGVVGAKTVIVHGVGLTDADIADAAPRVRGLVVCPTTHRYLLDAAPPIEKWIASGGRLAVGSDSRLTAHGDLLDEMAAFPILADRQTDAMYIVGIAPPPVTPSGDWIAVRADLNRLPRRADLALIVRAGKPMIGDAEAWRLAFPQARTVSAMLDGKPKQIALSLARQVTRCTLGEPGLSIDFNST